MQMVKGIFPERSQVWGIEVGKGFQCKGSRGYDEKFLGKVRGLGSVLSFEWQCRLGEGRMAEYLLDMFAFLVLFYER